MDIYLVIAGVTLIGLVIFCIVSGQIRRREKEWRREVQERRKRQQMWAAHRPERERQMMPQREKAREKKHLKQQALKNIKRSDRGTWSERQLVRTLLKAGIPNQVIFHDLYLRKPNGGCAQIDVVVPTSAGIIVFEVKDYSGWLFGKGDQEQWTQVLAYGISIIPSDKTSAMSKSSKNNFGHLERSLFIRLWCFMVIANCGTFVLYPTAHSLSNRSEY